MMNQINLIINDLKKLPFIIPFAIGIVLRSQLILRSSFPINDGGMFLIMVRELIDNGFKLPLYTNYNFSEIPYAYPPFGFYFAAITSVLLKIEIIQLLRFIPLTNSILTIPAFYLLSKNFFSQKNSLFATLVFSIMPRSFEWQIMGGGLTRSFGFLFSIITIYFFTKNGDRKNLIIGSMFFGLATLSHLEWGAFTAGTIILLILVRKIKINNILFVILPALILVIPWLGIILSRFGLQPFLSFLDAGVALKNTLIYTQVIFLAITDEPFLSLFGVLAILGLFIQIARKDWFTVFWLIFPIILAQRSAPNLTALPLSMLAGVAISEINIKISTLNQNKKLPLNKVFIIFVFTYSVLNTIGLVFIQYDYYYFDSLSKRQRTEMSLISEKIPENECVMVFSNKSQRAWGIDYISEWFPALTGHKSPITPQGTEWLSGKSFNDKIYFYSEAKGCFNKGIECLNKVMDKYKTSCNFYYVETPQMNSSSTALINYQFVESVNYSPLFIGETASLYEKR